MTSENGVVFRLQQADDRSAEDGAGEGAVDTVEQPRPIDGVSVCRSQGATLDTSGTR